MVATTRRRRAPAAWAYATFGGRSSQGNALLIDQIHEPTAWVPRRMAPFVLVGTWITHLFGGSAGREGTALQMSGSLSDAVARVLRLPNDGRVLLLLASLAGGFGAVFGVPLAGAVFAMEVPALGRVRYEAIVPTLTAAIVGDLVVGGLGYEHALRPAARRAARRLAARPPGGRRPGVRSGRRGVRRAGPRRSLAHHPMAALAGAAGRGGRRGHRRSGPAVRPPVPRAVPAVGRRCAGRPARRRLGVRAEDPVHRHHVGVRLPGRRGDAAVRRGRHARRHAGAGARPRPDASWPPSGSWRCSPARPTCRWPARSWGPSCSAAG